MKVEQACRFRLDEGYCIFAKSAGLKPAQEEALGDIFNSTMNTIFPRTGASVLSCTPGRNDAFLARNTLRTDILGRKTIFTHAYVFSAEEYARVMEEEPLVLLSVPMEQMLDSQTPGAQMEQLELAAPASPAATLEALFEKYHLTPQRYGKLLLGAYEAMTSNGSLRLKTNLPLEQTEQLVREMTVCILDGLLPVLKGKVSFSSGSDTRMKISVIPAGDNASSSDIIFGVEDDGCTNIRPKDEVSAIAFDALGKASHEERRQVLQQMQNWLNEVTNVQEGLSVMLVSAAYCLSSGQALTLDTIMMLFRSISTAKGFSTYVTNSLLTDLLKRMNEQGSCPPKALSQIAGWYLKDSSAAYRAEADRALAAAPVEICAALVEAVFNQPMTDNTRQMLHTLLRRVPPESQALTADVQNHVVLWILSENVEQFTEYATVLMMNYNDSQMLQLAKGILTGSAGRGLNSSKDVMLAKALRRLTAVKASLTAEECALLDGHSSQYSDDLMASALDYLFQVRFTGDIYAGLDLLERLSVRQPQYFVRIVDEITSGRRSTGQLWEHYQARHCFRSGMTAKDIAQVCHTSNTFNNPGGVFEQQVTERWMTLVEAEFASYGEKDVALQYFADTLTNRWLGYTEQLNISAQTKAAIGSKITKILWDSISFTQIYANEYPVAEQLKVKTPQSELKIQLLDLCLALRRDPRDTQQLIQLIQSEQTNEKHWQELKTCAGTMVFALLNSKQFLSWDLVLLSCWTRTEKGSTVDTEQLVSHCGKLDKFFEKQRRPYRMEASDSLLLRDDKLSKTICRIGNDLPQVLQELINQLKPEKKGLLQNLFGGGQSREKAAPETQRPGRYAAESQRRDRDMAELQRRDRNIPEPQRKNDRKGRTYDPTDINWPNHADQNGKKGKGNSRR